MAHNCQHVDEQFGKCTLAWHVNGQHVYFGQTVTLRPSRVVVDPERVTRFEVVDQFGRCVVEYNVCVELSTQDDGRTLKVFLSKRPDVEQGD